MAVEKFPVEAGHIMMFARAIGDVNKIYHDEEYASTTEVGSVIAPPTFVQASAQFDPNYFLRPKVGGDGWFGSGKEPTGVKKEAGGGGRRDGKAQTYPHTGDIALHRRIDKLADFSEINDFVEVIVNFLPT